jgi:hypothetical protein
MINRREYLGLAAGAGASLALTPQWLHAGHSPRRPGGPPQPGAATVKAHIDTWLAWTKAARMDLVMLPPQSDTTWLDAMKEEKKGGASVTSACR